MKKVSGSQVVTSAQTSETPLPAEIAEALGELVGAAREGLLALSVRAPANGVCQWPSEIPQLRPDNSPLVAIVSPRWWPSNLPPSGLGWGGVRSGA